MNERIIKLAINCATHKDWDNPSVDPTEYTFSPSDVERFAQLIVRECIGCCEQVISDPVPESVDTWLNGGEQCIQEIKQHFGVKE